MTCFIINSLLIWMHSNKSIVNELAIPANQMKMNPYFLLSVIAVVLFECYAYCVIIEVHI